LPVAGWRRRLAASRSRFGKVTKLFYVNAELTYAG
jgi:hypothetical protein